jgi:ABC-2 type transport system ATP-binding protein
MKKLENVYEARWEAGKLKIYLAGGTHNLLNIMDALKTSGADFGQVYSELPTLNDVFLTITGKELRDKD